MKFCLSISQYDICLLKGQDGIYFSTQKATNYDMFHVYTARWLHQVDECKC